MVGKAVDDKFYELKFARSSARICAFLIFFIVFIAGPAWAGSWFATPRLTVREIYSDNINLSPSGSAQSALVTEIDPGISLQRIGGRTQVNLNYQMQNVINGGGAGGTRVNHQLQAGAATVIKPNRLSISANSSILQQNVVNTGAVATGNLNNFANRADVYTFSLNPTWTPHFDGFADGVVQLGYDFVGTSSIQAADSNTFRGSLGLNSGYRFNRITWQLGYNDVYSMRAAGGDVRFRNYFGQINYNFNRKYSVFVQGGYFDNSLPNVVSANNQNGVFYTLGAAWSPNRRFRLQGGYGQNLYFVGLRWLPTFRTNINLRFQHSSVGTNTGSVWSADISHQSARVSWLANYSENTTTFQNILLNQSIFNSVNNSVQTSINPAGQPTFSPVITQPFASNVGLPTFTNNILIQRLGQISVGGGTAKSTLGLTLFSSRREDQSNLVDDNSLGASAFWSWRFLPRTNSRLLLSWNRNTTNIPSVTIPNNQSNQANFYVVSLGLTRNIADYFDIARGIFGSIDYRYARQDSSNPIFSYIENSVAATLTVNF